MTTPQSALADLTALADPKIANEMALQHKINRPYLGVTNPQIDDLYKTWRTDTDLNQRIAIAAHLWDSNIHESRSAAAKLLTQARINPDDAVWTEIERWVPSFDTTAIADHACSAGARRLIANPIRLDTVETWIEHETLWVRRATLMMTLPWAKLNHPSDTEIAVRARVLDWAAAFTSETDPIMQKSVALWLRTLSKHDKSQVIGFLDEHGTKMKAFALKEASPFL